MPPKDPTNALICGVIAGLVAACQGGWGLRLLLRALFVFGGIPFWFVPIVGGGIHIGGALIIYVVLACVMPPPGGDS